MKIAFQEEYWKQRKIADTTLERLNRNEKFLTKSSSVMRKDHSAAAGALSKMLWIYAVNGMFDGKLKEAVRQIAQKHGGMETYDGLCELNEEALKLKAELKARKRGKEE